MRAIHPDKNTENHKEPKEIPTDTSSNLTMGVLQFNHPPFTTTTTILFPTAKPPKLFHWQSQVSPPTCRTRLIHAAVETSPAASATTEAGNASEDPPAIAFAFVSPRLLPDGTPDIHIRSSKGGRKLRDIMLDGNIDLYGPYDKPLSNCAGGGTCGTCLVEVVEGKELLSPRTDKEKEALKRNPKTWRLACQTMVGKHDSTGEVVIQQLPEWKVHEWE